MTEWFAKWLWVPDPHGRLNREHMYAGSIDQPSHQDAERAVESLNGDTVSMIVVSEHQPSPYGDAPFGGRALVVSGGGSNGLYMCEYYRDEDSDPLRACDPTIERGTLDIKRGEYTRVPLACGIRKDVALSAAKLFLEHGEPAPDIQWRDADDIPF